MPVASQPGDTDLPDGDHGAGRSERSVRQGAEGGRLGAVAVAVGERPAAVRVRDAVRALDVAQRVAGLLLGLFGPGKPVAVTGSGAELRPSRRRRQQAQQTQKTQRHLGNGEQMLAIGRGRPVVRGQ